MQHFILKRRPSRTYFRPVLASIALLAAQCTTAIAVENANIEVDGSGNVTIPTGQSTSGFSVTGNGATGVIPIQIGPSGTDDAANGILIGSVSEMGRDVLNSTGGTERLWASSSTVRDPSGSLSLATNKAGVDKADTLFPGTAPFDANMNAAYFPFSEGWVGGTVYANAGNTYDEFVLNGMTAADIQQDGLDPGLSLVNIPGVVDSRRQGIFLVNSAEANNVFGMSVPYSDGSSFVMESKLSDADQHARAAGDATSFVFLPLGTPNMTLARIHGGNYSEAPAAMISSGDDITLVREAPGRYRLSIAGQSPSSGSLLINQHAPHDDLETKDNTLGGDPRPSGGNSIDNLPSFVADGDDWIILSEDISDTDPLDGMTGGAADSFPQGQDAVGGTYFDLAFVPFSGGPTAPGPIPELSTVTGFSRSRVIGWNAEITLNTNGNSQGDMKATATSASTGISVSGLGSNKGDLNFFVDGARLASGDGVMLATVSEGERDNSAFLDEFDYGLANTTNQFSNHWSISTETAAGGVEHNVNVSAAFFGVDSGFEMGTLVDSNNGTGHIEVVIPGANSTTDGVLMANAWGNDDNFVTVTPKSDGSGWDLNVFDHNTSPEGAAGVFSDGANYVYLPYDSENLVAGRVNEDGTLINSTDVGGFTLTKQGSGLYLLDIVGKTFDDGMLLLNAIGEGESVDNTLVYERSGNAFLISGLDMVATTSELVLPEDTAFSFAFIDFVDDLRAPGGSLPGDYNGDGFVGQADLDLVLLNWGDTVPPDPIPTGWVNEQPSGLIGQANLDGVLLNWGSGTQGVGAASAAVPEPSTLGLLIGLLTLGAGTTRSRRR